MEWTEYDVKDTGKKTLISFNTEMLLICQQEISKNDSFRKSNKFVLHKTGVLQCAEYMSAFCLYVLFSSTTQTSMWLCLS